MAALLSSVILVSQAVTALEHPHQRRLFQSWYLMSEMDCRQQHCDVARTVSTIHCPLFQPVYRKLPYHKRYLVHEPTEFSSVPLIFAPLKVEDCGRKKTCRARKQEKRQKGTV